jgi:hypothetical protein
MDDNAMCHLVCLDLRTESLFQSYSRIIHRYTDIDVAITFIDSMRHVYILLTVSDHLAKETLTRLKFYRHVRGVFVLNQSSECSEMKCDEHESLVGIFQSESELEHAVQTQIVSIEKQALPFSIFDQMQQSSKDITNKFNIFLWYQVLFHTLKQMPADEQAKEEMLQICSDHYQHNPREERIIQEYRESSNENNAIHW